MHILPRPVVITWLTLTAATLLSWWLSTQEASGGDIIAVIIFTVAGIKIWLIGMYFMELRGAPRLLRGIFDLYVVALLVGLVGFFLAG